MGVILLLCFHWYTFFSLPTEPNTPSISSKPKTFKYEHPSKSTMFRKRGKRGVSPLIATVLLISFAVALGSVVLNWGKNLDMKGDDGCADVEIHLQQKNGAELCYRLEGEQAYINFALENRGDVPIQGLGIWIVGQKGTKLLDFDLVSIPSGDKIDIVDSSIPYDILTYGAIKQVQFIPKIKEKDSLDICPASSIKSDKIIAC